MLFVCLPDNTFVKSEAGDACLQHLRGDLQHTHLDLEQSSHNNLICVQLFTGLHCCLSDLFIVARQKLATDIFLVNIVPGFA